MQRNESVVVEPVSLPAPPRAEAAFSMLVEFDTASEWRLKIAQRRALMIDLAVLEAKIARLQRSGCIVKDLQDVENYDGSLGVDKALVAKCETAVGQLQWLPELAGRVGPSDDSGNVSGLRWASGALIERDLFLTAGHAFDPTGGGWKLPTRDGLPMRAADLALLMQVNFNYQVNGHDGTIRAGESFQVAELVEWREAGVDYAILRLQPNKAGELPGDKYGVLVVAPSDVKTKPQEPQEMLCIIQHPNGQPKKIEAGEMLDNRAGRISYESIDVLGGSSGAPIILSPSGMIVGIHTHGGCSAFGEAPYGTAIGIVRQASNVLASPNPA